MEIYTKEQLIEKLKEIANQGWIPNARHGNHGGIGNTLEDLLGINENNLPIPNANEWELKAQKMNTTSLVTLFHSEPSPRALKFVPSILLPSYGWKHQKAGKEYPENEMSFRQTIHGRSHSDRGFIVQIDRMERKILISFNYLNIHEKHSNWFDLVKRNIGLNELYPQPYWGFDDLEHKAGTKLHNCFYVRAEVRKESNKEYYKYSSVQMLQRFSFGGFINEIENANILVDFDARTGHNHGTKFRMRQNSLPLLYENVVTII